MDVDMSETQQGTASRAGQGVACAQRQGSSVAVAGVQAGGDGAQQAGPSSRSDMQQGMDAARDFMPTQAELKTREWVIRHVSAGCTAVRC